MSSLLSYSASTNLERDRVWLAFSEIENWPKFSGVYHSLRWSGFPWLSGSSILGKITYPHELPVRYVVEHCDPGKYVSYIGHSTEAGFASHHELQFVDSESGGTAIQVSYYLVGCEKVLHAGQKFVKRIVERWSQEFALYCDNLAQIRVATSGASERFRPEAVQFGEISVASRRGRR